MARRGAGRAVSSMGETVFALAMCFRSTVLIPWPLRRSQNTCQKIQLIAGEPVNAPRC